MSAIKLASRYAKSLLDLSIEKGKLEEVYSDVKTLKSVLGGSREFGLLLKSPIIHADKKIKIIETILAGKVSDLTLSFIRILVKKHRELYLNDVTLSFVSQYNAHKNITPVKIKSAVPLDEQTLNNLLEKVKREAGLENIELNTEVDESLIGGFVLQYEDKLFDASASKAIDLMKKELNINEFVKKY